ncbi:hypothetical protein CK203_043481 [Vitis vinifera]|uniref:Reverse transcriptase Ty1/copia-type domain-containing protein n=1 Tax=Vitis vinifera TaxID=29760 RepID=A0A438HR72_VITVI|nr:hypothetical protein CK203_043481 [Vitis vinifera]
MMTEFESKERKGERPARLFQQGYTRKNKDVNVIPPLGSSTPLNDTTMLSDDSSETNPKGKKTVGCKWVISVRYKSDGAIDRMNTITVIHSLVVNLDWPLRQFDVKNVFLHGDLLEELYMDPPLGFTPK